MKETDREIFRTLIQDAGYTAGHLTKILHMAGHTEVDRASVGHYRRKLLVGKAEL
jgi:hypothetical protein